MRNLFHTVKDLTGYFESEKIHYEKALNNVQILCYKIEECIHAVKRIITGDFDLLFTHKTDNTFFTVRNGKNEILFIFNNKIIDFETWKLAEMLEVKADLIRLKNYDIIVKSNILESLSRYDVSDIITKKGA